MNKEELEQIKRELSDLNVNRTDIYRIVHYEKFIAKAPERIDYLVNKLEKAMEIISFYNEAMHSVNCEEDIDGSLSCYAIYAEARNQADEFLEELEND